MRSQRDGWSPAMLAALSSKSLPRSLLRATRKKNLVSSEQLSKQVSVACGNSSSFSVMKPVSCRASRRNFSSRGRRTS